MNRAVASSGSDEPIRNASLVAATLVLTAWAWTMNAVVPSSSASSLQRLAGAAQVESPRGVDLRRPRRPPVCHSWRPVQWARNTVHSASRNDVGDRRRSLGVPAGGVGVRHPVGDVEPAEVVVEVDARRPTS